MPRSSDATGIQCPSCKHTSRRVIESRQALKIVYRRCLCENCGERYSTHEVRCDQENAKSISLASTVLDEIIELEQIVLNLRKIAEKPLNDFKLN